jgi:hypothetical protein
LPASSWICPGLTCIKSGRTRSRQLRGEGGISQCEDPRTHSHQQTCQLPIPVKRGNRHLCSRNWSAPQAATPNFWASSSRFFGGVEERCGVAVPCQRSPRRLASICKPEKARTTRKMDASRDQLHNH